MKHLKMTKQIIILLFILKTASFGATLESFVQTAFDNDPYIKYPPKK